MLPKVLSALSTRLLTQLLTLVVGIIAARVLGTEERGTLAVMLAVSSVIGVIGVAGLDTANLYFAGMSPRAFSFVARWALLFGLFAGTGLASTYLVVALLWPEARFDLSTKQLVASAALSPVVTMTALLGVAEAGRGRLGRYNLTIVFAVSAYLLLASVFSLLDRSSATAYFLAYAVAQALTLLALVWGAAPWREGVGEAPDLRTYLTFGARAFVLNAIQYVTLRADILMIQALAGATAAGHYAVAYPLAESLIMVAIAVNLVVLPEAARKDNSLQGALRQAVTVLVGSMICAAAAAVTVPLFIPRIFGEEFRPSNAIFLTLLPGMVAFNFGRVLQTHLTAVNRLGWLIVAATASLATLVGLEYVLIPSRGATGAALASTLSYGLFSALVGALFFATVRRIGASDRVAPRSLRGHWSLSATLARPRTRSVVIGVALVTLAPVGTATLLLMPLALIGAAGLAVLLVALFRPTIGLTLVAAASPIPVALGALGATAYGGLLVFIVVILFGLLLRRDASWSRSGWLILLLLAYAYTSYTLIGGGARSSDNPLQGAYLVFSLWGPLLLFTLHPESRHLVRRNAAVYLVCSVLVSIWYLIGARDALAADTTGQSWIAVATAEELGNHNVLGAQLVLAVAILLPRLRIWSHPLQRLFLVSAVGILGAAILLSYSRSTYLAVPVMLGIFLLRRGFKGWVIAAAAAAAGLVLLPDSVRVRISFTTSGAGGGLDDSSAVRVGLWQAATDMFRDSPIWGVGLYDFGAALPRYWTYDQVSTFDPSQADFVFAHNSPLTILSQLGLLGAALIGYLVWSLANHSIRALRTEQNTVDSETALLALAGIGIASAFGEPLFNIALLCPFVMIMAFARSDEDGGSRHDFER